MNKKERKYPSVKVRLAPLPTRNLHFANSLNLEECLSRSVAMDRPLSRMSDLSNFSSNSMISVARSNYESQSDELRRQLNRNVIQALRSKDLRRRNYSNENRDNYSLDLNFNSNQVKRKRDTYDDDDSELNYGGDLFNRNSKTTKFARTDNLQIPSKNRFVSSQYKNNEIASSYSINNPTRNALASATKTNQLSDRFSPSIKRSFVGDDDKSSRKMFKVPLITISNASTNNLSNASASPIGRKSNEHSNNNSPNTLVKTSTNSISEPIADNQTLKDDKISSNKQENEFVRPEPPIETKPEFNYQVPERFHSIDEHKRDENKAMSRLGTFLKAIYNATTSSFLSSSLSSANESTNEQPSVLNAATTSTTITTTSDSLFTSTTLSATLSAKTTDSSTKTTDTTLSTQFKLPTFAADSKSNATSTPLKELKVTFNLPKSDAKPATTTTTTDSSSTIFKFGQTTNDQSKIDSSTKSSSLFKFGADLTKPNDTTSMFKSTATTTANPPLSNSTILPGKSNLSNFSFNNQDTTNSKSSSLLTTNDKSTPFSIALPTTSSFALPKTISSTTNLNSNLNTNSMFTFGTDQAAKTTQQDSNKSLNSSFVFKFGGGDKAAEPNKTLTAAPVFNFGQSTATTNTQQASNSAVGFNFGASLGNQNNLLSTAPSTTSFQAPFGSLNTNQQTTDQQANKSISTTNPLNFSFNDPNKAKPKETGAFNFGAPANTNFSSQVTSTPFKFDSLQNKPSFNFAATANNVGSNPSSNAGGFQFGGSQATNSNTSFTAPTTFNFGQNSSATSNMFTIGRK